MNVKPATHPLRVIREDAGLSQARLAALSGVSDVTISHIETGQVTPRPDTLAKLANAVSAYSGDRIRWKHLRA